VDQFASITLFVAAVEEGSLVAAGTLGKLIRRMIRSVGTARSFEQCLRDFLWWRVAQGISIDAPVTRAEIEAYLLQESVRWRQKTVDQHRQALSLVYSVALTHVEAGIPTIAVGRAYTLDEMERIACRQASQNAPATRIAFHSGLRAAEFPEPRDARELAPEANRPWRNDLFTGMPGGIGYRTVGKGGLARSALIPHC
jgi:hypothetical protein